MIKLKKRAFVFILIGTVLATVLAGAAGLSVFSNVSGMKLVKNEDFQAMEELSEKYGKLYTLQQTVNDRFLWETDENAQMDAMYQALVNSLGDQYSSYMNEEEYKKWKEYITGVFYGIGITFAENQKGQIEVKSVVEGGPADLAGMKAGDILLKADGKSYPSSDDFAAAIRGEQGTKVKLTCRRGDSIKTFSMVRGEVEESSVYAGTIDGEYGYIRITSFEQNTADQFATELADMENKNLKGFVLDLRENLGGIVDQSIEIADMLLPECTIIHTEDAAGKKEYYNSDSKHTKLPYVVLVNQNTASSGEILAAAVKENQGGKLVGETTFGKGIIQSFIEFSDGTAIRLTTMQYLSPKDHAIHKKGVEPDYKVKLTERSKTDKQLEKALSLLSS